MENKPWLSVYGGNIPEFVDADAYPSVVHMLEEAYSRFGNQVAYSNFGATLSYADVDRLSQHFAAWLQNVAGVEQGDRIALMAPNMNAFPVAMHGILRAGCIQVSVNPLYTPRELKHQLVDAGAEIIVIYAGSTAALAEIIAETSVRQVVIIGLDDLVDRNLPTPQPDSRLQGATPFLSALREGSVQAFRRVELQGSDIIFLQYTGGTTGLSKGATLSHRNMVANIVQYEAFAGDYIRWGEDVVMTAIPMYHIFALMVNALAYFRYGAYNTLITNPRDMESFAAAWQDRPVSVFTAVNTLFNGLVNTPGFEKADFTQLRVCVGGGMAVQAAVSQHWKRVTGRHIGQGYGLSETSPVLTLNPFGEDSFSGSIGIPLPSTEIAIRDDDGRDLPVGEPGELCARGPQVMVGYWQRPDATAEVMTDDGYFRTGDIATMDENGFFRIVDRKKDMILVSGFNVYPNEVEAEVACHEAVLECACVGVPDERSGEAVKLFVVRKDPALSVEELRDFCAERMTAYKVPSEIEFIDEVPKSAVGKILRRELRDAGAAGG